MSKNLELGFGSGHMSESLRREHWEYLHQELNNLSITCTKTLKEWQKVCKHLLNCIIHILFCQ